MKTYAMALSAGTAQQDGAVQVVCRLQRAGFTAYWAGGCVRDLLMGRSPKDFDVATQALPDEVLALFPGSVATGKSFGVVRVPVQAACYEVATFRQDLGYTDGRHPVDVAFSDPETDAQRRDFTINALFYDPVAGTVLDYVEGRADIDARVVQTVGDPKMRFREDHLRMLRAVRFTATLGFTLDPATAAAIRRMAAAIATISAERIRDELSRIWVESPRAGDALVLLDETGLLNAILPEVAAMRGQAQPPEFHPEGDVFRHTVMMLNAMRAADIRLAWSLLLHDVGKPPTARTVDGRVRFEQHAGVGDALTRRILERLRFPNDDIEAIAFAVGNHMRFVNVNEMRRATLRRLVGAPTFPLELELHRLDCLASHGNLGNYHFLAEFRKALAAEPVLPAPWITGRDIMAIGIPEGPEVGRWRQKAYELQLEGALPNRAALLDWLAQAVAESRPPGNDPARS
jgi:tRNA nucleotidyltransferase/poly(A) polymerase